MLGVYGNANYLRHSNINLVEIKKVIMSRPDIRPIKLVLGNDLKREDLAAASAISCLVTGTPSDTKNTCVV